MQTDIVKDLNFEDKAKWFKFQYEKTRIPWTLGADYLKVSEHNLLKTVQNGIRKVNLHKVTLTIVALMTKNLYLGGQNCL